ncbi:MULTISPECIES: glycosyltransferase family 2 protein [unclassified Ruegeria]|uniref:glycosyltransferase family 2 protein n=1 Tax=unclassified Ruegeria TaxID=2625375 RepID=UPI001492D530|nr:MULTISPECIES: glycosyltransferase family 2 protein [unclassified Ruegeria]NOD78573.1 glycosyltransferase [Ruegeria sp. HKCCD4332]NOD90946.1 glycosyltransferase [Ruegeria sp. HKCCD4318]NOE16334.1 glycosyltransferase [Ruegeria sp. HKCCD4318-2]NOG11800.1 glycosyltransferase family 2 protein [Ruegeria sp. HKCCD4315]
MNSQTQEAVHELAQTADRTRPGLSIVVPCYNEEAVLDELVRRATHVAAETFGTDYELVLIDDGSTDRTVEMIEGFANQNPNIRGVVLSRNHGHQRALSAGLIHCRGEIVLVLDADLQDPPELLPDMLAVLNEGADVVYGQRIKREGESLAKKTTASAFYRLLRLLSDVEIPLDTGDFRLMRRKVVDYLNTMPEEDRFIRGMVSWLGFRQVKFSYERAERFAGETKYPFRKMLRLAIDGVTGFSTVPLRIASWLALSMTVVSLGLFVWVILQRIAGETVSGWASTVVVVLLVSSVQLFTIGILGEYVGRLYMQSKKRPLFVVDRLISHDRDG